MNVLPYSYQPESLHFASWYNVEQVRLISQDNNMNWKQFEIIFIRVEANIYLILWKWLADCSRGVIVHLVCHISVDRFPSFLELLMTQGKEAVETGYSLVFGKGEYPENAI